MRADIVGQIDTRDYGIFQVLFGGLFGTVKKLFAVDDFENSVAGIVVGEVDAVAFRSGGDGAVKAAGSRSLRAGLLAGEAEVTDEDRVRGITQVVDLRHALGAPADDAGDQIRDAAVAFPPAFVGIAKSADDHVEAI